MDNYSTFQNNNNYYYSSMFGPHMMPQKAIDPLMDYVDSRFWDHSNYRRGSSNDVRLRTFCRAAIAIVTDISDGIETPSDALVAFSADAHSLERIVEQFTHDQAAVIERKDKEIRYLSESVMALKSLCPSVEVARDKIAAACGWCRINIPKYRVDDAVFYFSNDLDATKFALFWA